MGLTDETMGDFQLLESMLWTPESGFFLFERHMSRLQAAADYFGFALDLAMVVQEASDYAWHLTGQPHKVRLLVSRDGESAWQAAPIPAGTGDNAPRVALLSQPLDTSSPFFRFKTTYRPHYDRALASFPDCDDVLLWNLQGQLTESCRANLVLELGGALLTPPLTSGLLDGTFRAELLAQGVIRESELYPDDLLSARQVMLINSVRKWIPVTLLS